MDVFMKLRNLLPAYRVLHAVIRCVLADVLSQKVLFSQNVRYLQSKARLHDFSGTSKPSSNVNMVSLQAQEGVLRTYGVSSLSHWTLKKIQIE